jgi:aminoglycoside phosphotransferase (APT) family kinase protein
VVSDQPVMPIGVPAAEIEIDEVLVRALLRAQHPDLADLRLTLTAVGWDNVTYRLGEQLAVRLPRIRAGSQLLRREHRWLPVLAGRLPIRVPVPVRLGEPEGEMFPWPWSVVPWIPGRSAELGLLDPAQAATFVDTWRRYTIRPPTTFPATTGAASRSRTLPNGSTSNCTISPARCR